LSAHGCYQFSSGVQEEEFQQFQEELQACSTRRNSRRNSKRIPGGIPKGFPAFLPRFEYMCMGHFVAPASISLNDINPGEWRGLGFMRPTPPNNYNLAVRTTTIDRIQKDWVVRATTHGDTGAENPRVDFLQWSFNDFRKHFERHNINSAVLWVNEILGHPSDSRSPGNIENFKIK
jgi:hypothetical protein